MPISDTRSAPIDGYPSAAAPISPRIWHVLTLGDRLGRRTAVVLSLAAAIGLGLFLGWSYVVAAGLASLVLGVLPCAAMCALGLCASAGGKKCSHDKNIDGGPR